MEALDIRLDLIIVAILALVGAVFGSSGGVWAYLTFRHRQKMESELAEVNTLQRGTATAMGALERTVEILRKRQDANNIEYAALQSHHQLEISSSKASHMAELASLKATYTADLMEATLRFNTTRGQYDQEMSEMKRGMRILQAQFSDCKRMLEAKIAEIEATNARMGRLMTRLQPLLPAQDAQEN